MTATQHQISFNSWKQLKKIWFFDPKTKRKSYALYHALGTSSLSYLKAIIQINLIKNNSVTKEDIDLVGKTFGPNVSTIKGKTTRTSAAPFVSNLVEIPDELLETHRDITISMESLTVNSLKFLSIISHDIYYHTAQYVSQPIGSVYEKCLGGFEIPEVHCHIESHKVMDNYSIKQGPPIELCSGQNTRSTCKSKQLHNTRMCMWNVSRIGLPYTHSPHIFGQISGNRGSMKINFFQISMASPNTLAPWMVFHQENKDYDCQCKHALEDHVQVQDDNEPKYTTARCSLDSFYLHPTLSKQEGHELLHLQTNGVIIRHKVTPVPVTSSIISQAHALAPLDPMPPDLNITNCTNQILFDSAWTLQSIRVSRLGL